MVLADRELSCVDCGAPFPFTAGEQALYDRHRFAEPRRCRACRQARKARRTGQLLEVLRAASAVQGPPVGGGRGSGRESEAGPREARGSGRGARPRFAAVCAACGSPTRVPRKPTAGRPAYCRACFQARRGAGGATR